MACSRDAFDPNRARQGCNMFALQLFFCDPILFGYFFLMRFIFFRFFGPWGQPYLLLKRQTVGPDLPRPCQTSLCPRKETAPEIRAARVFQGLIIFCMYFLNFPDFQISRFGSHRLPGPRRRFSAMLKGSFRPESCPARLQYVRIPVFCVRGDSFWVFFFMLHILQILRALGPALFALEKTNSRP